MAGLKPNDMDVAEIYNSFAIQEPLGIESLGFAKQGDGWKGAEDGSTWIDGKVGVNLSGGLLCKGHPLGATGTSQAVDVVEQLARYGSRGHPAQERLERHQRLPRRTGRRGRDSHLPAHGGLSQ